MSLSGSLGKGETGSCTCGLCLWAGANPHAPAPDLELGVRFYSEPEEGEKPFIGRSAISEAARSGNLDVLKKLGPDPVVDDFDEMYRWTKSSGVVDFLASIEPPKDLAAILEWQLRMAVHPWPECSGGLWVVEALLSCSPRWEERDPDKLGEIRRLLLRLSDNDLQTIVKRLKRPDVCAIDTYRELIHTPNMKKRLVALGLL